MIAPDEMLHSQSPTRLHKFFEGRRKILARTWSRRRDEISKRLDFLLTEVITYSLSTVEPR